MDVTEIIRIASDIRSLGTLLAGTLTLVGLICALLIMFTRRGTDLPVKLLGTLLVLAICLASQNGFVYSIGVFIVATLVTELQFLEKIAALVWNRKEYWEYLSKASPADVRKKIARESRQIAEARADVTLPAVEVRAEGQVEQRRTTVDVNRSVQSGLHFHRAVIKALRSSKSPLKSANVHSDILVQQSSGRLLIDAIVESQSVVYLIEIKAGFSLRLVKQAVRQIRRYLETIPVLNERYSARPLQGIVVIPPTNDAPLSVDGIALLQFDPKTGDFPNGEAIQRFLKGEV